MAQFVAYRTDIEVSIHLLTPYFNSDTRGRNTRAALFLKHGIDLNTRNVYPIETFLNCFRDIAQELGEMNLFLIGKSSAQGMEFPPCKNFKEIVEHFNKLYHLSYTINGKPMYDAITDTFEQGMGNYTVPYFDEEEQKMYIKASSPFSSKSDEGLFLGLFEKYKPKHINSFDLRLDVTKERRSMGGNSCTFILTWK